MATRISGLAIAAALAAPVSLAQASTASADTAQVFVTGYVLRGYTATGTYVHPGTCAVDPDVIPLGSYVTIQGLGTCHAEDTGSAIIGYHIDVWVPTVAQAYALTGWYTASWGPSPPQQGPASPAAQPRSLAPLSKRLSHPQARAAGAALQRWYSHDNPYVHRDPRAPARRSVALRPAAHISVPVAHCPAVPWTTHVAHAPACAMATLPTLRDDKWDGRAALQRWYSHGNPFVHRYVRRDPRAPARHSVAHVAQRPAALVSLPAKHCHAVPWTTIVARVPACTLTMTTLPTLRVSQESVGLHGSAPVAHVDGPPAPARGHEAGVRSAEQAHLERWSASRLRERGAPRGASGGRGSAVKVAWSVAATEAPVPPVWALAITMLAVVASGLRRCR